MSNYPEFKRLNFFTGFFTTAQDWNEGQDYHLEKRKLHQQWLHTPGIIAGLEVQLDDAGERKLQVQPGIALDNLGNLLSLSEAWSGEVNAEQLPACVYVMLEYGDKDADPVHNVQDPDYSGYTRKLEKPQVTLLYEPTDASPSSDPATSGDTPTDAKFVELARLQLSKDVTAIPPSAIDRRHVLRAGAKDDRLTLLPTQLGWLFQYEAEKRQLQNRGLHKPGIMHGLDMELNVVAVGDLTVEVQPGAALDALGNEIWLQKARRLTIQPPADLPQVVYMAIKFENEFANIFTNPQADYENITERVVLAVTTTEPDNQTWLELARIDLQPNVTVINNPATPGNPKGNELDRRFIQIAGSVDIEKEQHLAAIGERLKRLHEYHLVKQRRHNQGLHEPGILRDVAGELKVTAAGGLTVQIEPGAALDGNGNELYLDQPYRLTLTAPATNSCIYIAAHYTDQFADYLADLAQGFGGSYRTVQFVATLAQPDNQTKIELAHVVLEAGATEIREPADPEHPKDNELDPRDREWSGSVGLVPPRLPPDIQDHIVQVMQSTRTHFVELDRRFSVPVLDDVRQAAVHLKLLVGMLEPAQLPSMLQTIANLEITVQQELAHVYPMLVPKSEFMAYQDAVASLNDAFRQHLPIDTILTRQAQVAEAAHTLSLVVFPPPIADAGPDQTVEIVGDEIKIMLDASGSHAGDKLKIVKYRWEKVI